MFVPNRQSARRQRGFTLIEALIAFVILSIGLLGIVSLQAMAKASQHLAIQHTRAVLLGDAIVERIRVNPAAMATYNIGTGNPRGDDPGATEPRDCSTGAECTPTELATHDLWAWEQALAGAGVRVGGANVAGLTEPRGCIEFAVVSPPELPTARTNSGLLTVIIQWRGLQDSFDAVQAGETVCGGAAAGTDPYRRQVVINTFVVDEEEF